MGTAGYFIYQGVKVTTPGKAEEIEKLLNLSILERDHAGAGRVPRALSTVKVLSRETLTTLSVER